jgi:nicotinamidase/pyrazinamidase
VLNTVIDALQHHYTTFVLEDAISAINLKPDDGVNALQAMTRLGATSIRFGGFVV